MHSLAYKKLFNVQIGLTTPLLYLILLFSCSPSTLAQLIGKPESSSDVPFKFDAQFGDSSQSTTQAAPTFSLIQFAESFKIQKALSDPSRLLNVYLPSTFQSFRQFIARVTDISSVTENRLRDANRTFLASLADSSLINIHGLNPGHRYSIAILGRREAEATLIKEESVIMDPVPLDFGSSSSIQTSFTNITMRVTKPDRALQDTFRVEYVQVEPLKRFPILDVHDIQDQKQVELYLGNLNPGRDYEVTVTSLKDDLPSRPWREIITTKPLRPGNLSVAEINSTCVKLSWVLSAESGVDIFKIAYGVLHGENNMVKIETPRAQEQVDLCDVVPGQTYIFAVIAEKSHQISDPTTMSHTVRPLSPKDLSVEADFDKAKFRLSVDLPSLGESRAEKCSIAVSSEHFVGSEQIVKAQAQGSALSCVAYMDLVPGLRYEISAASISGQKSSTKTFRSMALEPGFDFNSFGLSIQESSAGTLRLEWPNSEVSMMRISDLWMRIVGNDSRLHFTLNPYDQASGEKEQVRQVESSPADNRPILIDQLRRGGCYKIHLYTVTSSGIVSKHRYEQFLRLQTPVVEVAIGQITKNSAIIQAFVIRPTSAFESLRLAQSSSTPSNDPQESRGSSAIANECILNIVVLDRHSVIVYDKTLPLKETSAPTLPLDGLRPFFKYTVNSQVVCGQNPAPSAETCPQKIHSIQPLTFETRQDRPGQVQNLTIRALNPYSVQLAWLPPVLRNGVVTHYVVYVTPEDQEEKPWSVNVAATLAPHVFFMNDGSESLLPVNGTTAPPVEATVDNLTGGQSYKMNVVAVTEAGAGDAPLESVQILMPIAAPLRPPFQLEIVPNSVRSKELTVRYNTALFSNKHGLITKTALIVAEIAANGKSVEEGHHYVRSAGNRSTPTWSQVQAYEVWPPYVAIESVPEGKRFVPRIVTEVVGMDALCSDRDSLAVCNGPLKSASNYRIKLRLYTSPTLWTDTLYSEAATTAGYNNSENPLLKLFEEGEAPIFAPNIFVVVP